MPAVYNPMVPWHLWGGAEVLELNVGAAVASVQMAKVSYGRPESWRFLFTARMLSAPTNGSAVEHVILDFDVTVGIGRYSTTLGREDVPVPSPTNAEETRGFARFHFIRSEPNFPSRYAWLTTGWSPIADSVDGVAVPRVTDVIVAQDIQCRVRAGAFAGSGTPVPLKVQVAAYFAPNVHIRPDWLADADEQTRFRGNEVGGM
jgi:hypothetical protein